MDNREKILQELQNPIRKEHNFRDVKADSEASKSEYIKKLFSAPLAGCGGGIVLFTTTIASEKATPFIRANLVPSLWFFFIGIIASIVAAAYYFRYFQDHAESMGFRGDAQASFLNLRDKLWLNNPELLGKLPDELITSTEMQIAEIAEWNVNGDKKENTANDFLSKTYRTLVFSGIMFVLGVAVPLIAITSQVRFIFL